MVTFYFIKSELSTLEKLILLLIINDICTNQIIYLSKNILSIIIFVIFFDIFLTIILAHATKITFSCDFRQFDLKFENTLPSKGYTDVFKDTS